MVVVKSKLKIPACKPEVHVQQTDMTSVYEICHKSQMECVLTCHILRMHFCLFSFVFKGNFQNHLFIFRKCQFSKFCKKNSKFPKIQIGSLRFCLCHDADHMCNENSLKVFIVNHFFTKIANLNFCPKRFALICHPHY